MTNIYDSDVFEDKEGIELSVVDDEAAPDASAELHSDIPETAKEEAEGLESTTAAADELLEGESLNQWQAEGDVEAETDAAVMDGKTRPSPAETVGEEMGKKAADAFSQAPEEFVETSVVDMYAPQNASDELHSDIPETKKEEKEGLESTSTAADKVLEGESLDQWQAQGDVESVTHAAVSDGKTKPSPAETAGEEDNAELDQEATGPVQSRGPKNFDQTSVINQYSADNDDSYELQKEVPNRKKGLEGTTAAAGLELQGDAIDQWQAQGDVESQTHAAVSDGTTEPLPDDTASDADNAELDQEATGPILERGPKEFVKTSVINQYAVPSMDDELRTDIPETKKEEMEGLETTTATADHILEGTTLNQWQAEGNVEAQTNAAVADGKTRPSPSETVGEEDNAELDQSATGSVHSRSPKEHVETSVINQYAAPNEDDMLHSDIPETKKEAQEGLESTSAAADEVLEGESIVQWEAEYDVQSETDAAVMDGKTRPSPPRTVGEEDNAELDQSAAESSKGSIDYDLVGITTSVVDEEAAPATADLLHSDIPETKAEANEGLESSSAAAAELLEGESIVQWDAEYTVEAETDAAVMDGATRPSPELTVGEEESGEIS